MIRTLLTIAVVVLMTPALAEAKLNASALKAQVVKLDAQGNCVAAPACCPLPCISYKHHRPCKKICCTCAPPVQTVLLVKDPCVCGCYIQVPVCLPACCTGTPEVCCHKGFLGRDVVEYNWCCGYRIKMVFDRRGDLTVHSFGS